MPVENITSWFVCVVTAAFVIFFGYMFFIDFYTTHVNINKTCGACRNLATNNEREFVCSSGCRNEPTPDLIACIAFSRWYPED